MAPLRNRSARTCWTFSQLCVVEHANERLSGEYPRPQEANFCGRERRRLSCRYYTFGQPDPRISLGAIQTLNDRCDSLPLGLTDRAINESTAVCCADWCDRVTFVFHSSACRYSRENWRMSALGHVNGDQLDPARFLIRSQGKNRCGIGLPVVGAGKMCGLPSVSRN